MKSVSVYLLENDATKCWRRVKVVGMQPKHIRKEYNRNLHTHTNRKNKEWRKWKKGSRRKKHWNAILFLLSCCPALSINRHVVIHNYSLARSLSLFLTYLVDEWNVWALHFCQGASQPTSQTDWQIPFISLLLLSVCLNPVRVVVIVVATSFMRQTKFVEILKLCGVGHTWPFACDKD